MNKVPFLLEICMALLPLSWLNSCTSLPKEPAAAPLTAYQQFVLKSEKYPKTMEYYEDTALMAKATAKCPIYVCLDQQRGRLYVDGQVAADWPVSTGIPGRATPTGKFKVILKKRDHSSNRYGKMYDAEGKVTDRDADAFNDEVPEGGKFVGASMPYWQRLTKDGVGMHTGVVKAGRRLSHGCIRTPNYMARRLFSITETNVTPVTVTQAPEACYPALAQLKEKAERQAQQKAAKEAAEQKARKEGRAVVSRRES